MRLLIVSLMLSVMILVGQPPITQLPMTAPAPPMVPPQSISAARVGVQGNSTYYYFVVAIYPIGSSSISGPAQVVGVNPTLSVSNYVTVGWQSMPSATSYSVLRSTSPSVPSTPCTCLVGTTTSTSLNDQSNTLTSFTLNLARVANGNLGIDNLTQAVAFLNWALNGTNYQVGIWDSSATVGDCAVKSAIPGVMTTTPCNPGAGITYAAPYLLMGSDVMGPIFPLTKPGDTTFAWRNQEGGSLVNTNGAIFITTGPGSGAYDWRIREMVLPATPYTVTMAFRPLPMNSNAAEFYAGFVLVDSATGKLESFTIGENVSRVSVYTWTNVTTFDATIFQSQAQSSIWTQNALNFMRISDDGVDRNFYLSPDGVNFSLFFTEAAATFLTPNRIGFGVNTTGAAGVNIGMTVYSWKVE